MTTYEVAKEDRADWSRTVAIANHENRQIVKINYGLGGSDNLDTWIFSGIMIDGHFCEIDEIKAVMQELFPATHEPIIERLNDIAVSMELDCIE